MPEQCGDVWTAQLCRYAVCTGIGASGWDEALDYAAVLAELERPRPSERLPLAEETDPPKPGAVKGLVLVRATSADGDPAVTPDRSGADPEQEEESGDQADAGGLV